VSSTFLFCVTSLPIGSDQHKHNIALLSVALVLIYTCSIVRFRDDAITGL